MNSLQKRMQREHSMQRSLSSIILPATSTFFGFTFLLSIYLDSPAPYLLAYSWSLHSPALSHMGQSRGWFRSRNSSTLLRQFFTASESVTMCMFSATVVPQAIAGFGINAISGEPSDFLRSAPVALSRAGRPIVTRHILQDPATFRFGW